MHDEVRKAAAEHWTGLMRAADPSRSVELAFRDGCLVDARLGDERGLTAFRAALVLLGSEPVERAALDARSPTATLLDPTEVLAEADRCATERAELGAFASLQLVPTPVDGVDQHADARLDREAFDRLVETLLVVDGRRSIAAISGDRPVLGVAHDVAELAQRGLVAPSTPPVATAIAEPPPRETRVMRLKRGLLVGSVLGLSLACTSIALRITQFDPSATLGPGTVPVQASAVQPAAPIPLVAAPDSLLARTERAIPVQVLSLAPVRAVLGPAPDPSRIIRLPIPPVDIPDEALSLAIAEPAETDAPPPSDPVADSSSDVTTESSDVAAPDEDEVEAPAPVVAERAVARTLAAPALSAVYVSAVQPVDDAAIDEAPPQPSDEPVEDVPHEAPPAAQEAQEAPAPAPAPAPATAPAPQPQPQAQPQAQPTPQVAAPVHRNSGSPAAPAPPPTVTVTTPAPQVAEAIARERERVAALTLRVAVPPAPDVPNPPRQTVRANPSGPGGNPAANQDHKSGGDGGQSGKSDGGQKDSGKRRP